MLLLRGETKGIDSTSRFERSAQFKLKGFVQNSEQIRPTLIHKQEKEMMPSESSIEPGTLIFEKKGNG